MKKLILIIFISASFPAILFSQYKGGSYDGYFSILDTNTIVGIENNVGVVADFSLYQNYPNPFNPKTTIYYDLRKTGFVSLIIYDVLGNRVATLREGKQNEGSYKIEFDASDFPSGVYFYKLSADNVSLTKKMLLIK
ncbi:MAG: T9SS type A sorting domain-containing protein [Ignavibacteria bacterium]